jgi:hypothetical protein
VLLGSGSYPSKNSTGFPQILNSKGTTSIVMPNEPIPPPAEKPQKNPHQKGNQTYTRVYANEAASAEIYRAAPRFPAGSIIVREKLLAADAEQPELVAVMVKRDKGFSRRTGDWEYFVVEGDLSKISKRETTGSCARCRADAAATDYVFKTYLK